MMENYKHSATEAQKMIIQYFRDRMKEKKITQKQLCKILDVSETTLIRYFKIETQMPLAIYLEICGVLDLRPYLIPAEYDENHFQRIFFN